MICGQLTAPVGAYAGCLRGPMDPRARGEAPALVLWIDGAHAAEDQESSHPTRQGAGGVEEAARLQMGRDFSTP